MRFPVASDLKLCFPFCLLCPYDSPFVSRIFYYTCLSKFLQYFSENCQIFARNLKISRFGSKTRLTRAEIPARAYLPRMRGRFARCFCPDSGNIAQRYFPDDKKTPRGLLSLWIPRGVFVPVCFFMIKTKMM